MKVADLMRRSPFTFEFKVKKKPAGIKVVYELTQEEMDYMTGLAEKEGIET